MDGKLLGDSVKMIAVLFEVTPLDEKEAQYLDISDGLAAAFDDIDGFISVERFESLSTPGKILSLSFWRDDTTAWYDQTTIDSWQALGRHRKEAEEQERPGGLEDYRLRIASVVRDYTLDEDG